MSLSNLIKHRPGSHPITKKHFDFSNDRYAWYWIYLKTGRVFNTYDWYIAYRTKSFVAWKNYYYLNNSPIIRTSYKKIKKVICWRTRKYDLLREEMYEQED